VESDADCDTAKFWVSKLVNATAMSLMPDTCRGRRSDFGRVEAGYLCP
jgi:hypothetical protein